MKDGKCFASNLIVLMIAVAFAFALAMHDSAEKQAR
jgi:hypothetical protein